MGTNTSSEGISESSRMPTTTSSTTTTNTSSEGISESSRKLYLLFLAVVLPYLLRALESLGAQKIMDPLCDRCFGKGHNPLHDALLPSAKTLQQATAKKVNMQAVWAFEVSWHAAVVALGWTQSKAVSVAMLRLVFWHWMQPTMYAWTLVSYYDMIDSTQQVLGVLVLAKEVLYFLLTVLALCRNPAFLLVNIGAHKGHSLYYRDVLWYVCMPAKFVARCAFPDGPTGYHMGEVIAYGLLFAFDHCAVIALIWGAFSHE